MTAIELRDIMLNIANGKAEKYTNELAALDCESKTERKALTIQKKMSENCCMFLKFDFGGKFFETREKIIFSQTKKFIAYKDAYNALDSNGKEQFLVFAYPMMFVMNNFYEPRKKLLEYETDAAKVFEAKIIIGTLGEILGEWQRIWSEHGSMKCEVFG